MYVQTILDVHKKYNALVMSAFNNDAGFVAALDKVCNPSSDTCSEPLSLNSGHSRNVQITADSDFGAEQAWDPQQILFRI